MGLVLTSHSVSLDGFIAQPDGKPGPLHRWLFEGELTSRHDEHFHLTSSSRIVFDSLLDRIGATIAGRKTYDDSEGWGGKPPFDHPFFIVTHNLPPGATSGPFEFVTEGIQRAIERAKEAAGDKDVSVMGGQMVHQCIQAGLLDEIDVDLVPIFLGRGTRLFDRSGLPAVKLRRTRVVEAPGVTHLTYRILK